MKIIFAQGNPGKKYENTRHNIGFFLVDKIAKDHNIKFANKPKFYSQIAEFNDKGGKILLVKPTTFYNETGQAARALIDFYKCDPTTDLLVIHDELALPFSTIRTREKGSDAGNNGIKSLNAHLGQNYRRIRVGVYQPLRDHTNDVDFVLGHFTEDEQKKLQKIVEEVGQLSEAFLNDSFIPTKVTVS